VAPWPERIFQGRYPASAKPGQRQAIPQLYATELQTVMNALNDMNQKRVEWDCGTTGIGVLVSDSLMFQRGDPNPGDPHLSEIYGLALPLVKRGVPASPVQLENVTVPRYLEGFRVLLLTYHGMKPLGPEAHASLAEWVKRGGALVVCDDDSDPYHVVRDWWNTEGRRYATPRDHLFEQLGFSAASGEATLTTPSAWRHGKGEVYWLKENPVRLAQSTNGDERVIQLVKLAAQRAKLAWRETNYQLLQRGPYVIAAGLDESIAGAPRQLRGRFVNLFDPELRVRNLVELTPGSRYLLRDLDFARGRKPEVLASACKTLLLKQEAKSVSFMVEGVGNTSAVVLLRASATPRSITLAKQPLVNFNYSAKELVVWISFANAARPRELTIHF
jgi:hypothetical protein